MAQNSHQRKAADAVANWLAHNELNNAWLAEAAKVDPGTVGDFLNYERWPKTGTQGKIEKALGWPAGSIRQMGTGQSLDLPMDRADLSVGPKSEDDSYVAAPGERIEGGVGNDAVLRAIEQMQRDMQDMERRLSERLDGLEQPGP